MPKIYRIIFIVFFISFMNVYAYSISFSAGDTVYNLDLPENIVTKDDFEDFDAIESYSLSIDVFPVSDFIKNGLGKKFYTSKYFYKNYKTVTFEILKEGLNKNYPLISDPGVFESWEKDIYQDFIVFDIYQNGTLGSVLNSIGWYEIMVCKGDYCFKFYYSPKRPIDDFAPSLTKYIKPNKRIASKEDLAKGIEVRPGFSYAIYNAPQIFYNDLKEQNQDLPVYIRNFQQKHDELLPAIIECFKN